MGASDTSDASLGARSGTPDVVVDELADALAGSAPSGVSVGVQRISLSDVERLARSELGLTTGMVDVRRAEFASGRALLHRLLGIDDPILRASNGAPSFPPGVVGSLAHDREFAIGIVTHRPDVATIGVDLEPVAADTLTDEEAAIIVRGDDSVPGPLAAFVMKEAAYKAWSSLGGPMIDHHDVRIDHDGDEFRATVLVDPPPALPTEFTGRLTRTTRHWLALVVVER